MNDPHFLAALFEQQLLPGDTHSKIEAMATPANKASYFLDYVIEPALDINETSDFDKLLSIMQTCGYAHVQKLAITIKSEMDELDEIKSYKSGKLPFRWNFWN